MSDRTYVLDVPQTRKLAMYFDSAEVVPDSLCVVSGDAFDSERDLPDSGADGDPITLVVGKRVVRGRVVSMAYLVEVAP